MAGCTASWCTASLLWQDTCTSIKVHFFKTSRFLNCLGLLERTIRPFQLILNCLQFLYFRRWRRPIGLFSSRNVTYFFGLLLKTIRVFWGLTYLGAEFLLWSVDQKFIPSYFFSATCKFRKKCWRIQYNVIIWNLLSPFSARLISLISSARIRVFTYLKSLVSMTTRNHGQRSKAFFY